MIKALFAFAFALWSLAAPAMAAENLGAMDDVAPKSAHCEMITFAGDVEAPAAQDLPDCCRVPAPLLTEVAVVSPPFVFEPVRFDPATDDRAVLFVRRPELPPPRA